MLAPQSYYSQQTPQMGGATQQATQTIQPMNRTPSRVGLATLGGFQAPGGVNTTNQWQLIREGGNKEANSFPPPINDISWQGFFTKEVTGYSQKLFWVCGYGILPSASAAPKMIMFQWWHTQPVNITDHRQLSEEDWGNASIYIANMERLEDSFMNSQLSLVNQRVVNQETEYPNVIEMPEFQAPSQEIQEIIEIQEIQAPETKSVTQKSNKKRK